ncbi:ribonuclease H-like domain-containing protein, partial [Candidatus Micrarchaeota archaeon]|nr:ribonuclease H-like domain-containing protein [Candidatus Micrarchaeota archaeon]
MPETSGILLDADYRTNEQNESEIQLFVRTPQGLELFTDPSFKPYFFVICNDLSKTKAKLEKSFFGENRISITGIKTEPKANEKNVLKLSFKSTRDLIAARSELREWGELERREYDIPFTKRYLTDSALQPLSELKIQFTEQNGSKIIQKIKKTESTEIPKLKLAAFDLETYSPGRFSDPTKDPILMISLADRKKTLIFSTKKQWSTKKNARIFETEKEMIQGFFQEVQKKELDVLITYNGDSFDFPYIKDRAKTLGLKAPLGYNQSEPVLKRKGLENAAKLKGIQHLDAFQLVRLLSRFGVISLVKFDLESVVESLFGTEKNKLKANDINRIWDTEKGLEELFQYNLEDAAFTLKIVEQYWPLLVEFCRLIRFSLFDLCRTSASQAVEALLLIKSHETNTLAPNKPSEGTIKQRLMSSFIGGYVKEPVPGLHENIAVLDFRSLHPSIMIAHNISPDSLKCDHTACKKGKNISPD